VIFFVKRMASSPRGASATVAIRPAHVWKMAKPTEASTATIPSMRPRPTSMSSRCGANVTIVPGTGLPHRLGDIADD
jgi:hypothetical protein